MFNNGILTRIFELNNFCSTITDPVAMTQAELNLRDVVISIISERYPRASDVMIAPFDTQGANFSSNLYEATIITPEETVEIFAKLISMGNSLSAVSNQVFYSEKLVYTKLSAAFEKIQDKHEICDKRYKFPKYYENSIADGVQIIALENLATKGYMVHDSFQPIDWNYASSCIETLARFHALSFALSQEHPDVFQEAAKSLKILEIKGSEWDGLEGASLSVLEEEDQEKLSELLSGYKGWSKVFDLGSPRKTSVIIHGDYRPSNLLYKEVDGVNDVIPVDYQASRLGCPVADLIYFIVIGTDQQFRQQHYHQLVDHYYIHFAQAMKRLGLIPEELYGRREFESDMQEV